MTKIRCTNCESIGHLEHWCVYPKSASNAAPRLQRGDRLQLQNFGPLDLRLFLVDSVRPGRDGVSTEISLSEVKPL
ncbi:hypothetical protein G6024_14525 [Dietzia maris]|nr:hypothetical protein [Dietzia maris]MBB0998285.1 hypothetical protein [Dietzia maris]